MSCSSLSTSAYYNGGDDEDTADSYFARILLSLQIPSELSPRNLPPERWTTTKKRTDVVDELFSRFDSLQSNTEERRSFDGVVNVLKDRYRLNRKIGAGIEAFQFLRSKGLNGDDMLKVLDAIFNNGGKKRKIDMKLEEVKENPAPIMMMKKQKIEEIVKFKNISELIGEEDGGDDDLNGSIDYECKEVFSQALLDGHTTDSLKRKKKTEELVVIQTRSDLISQIEGEVSGLVEFGENNCVSNCNLLCPKSSRTGQAHKIKCHRETDGIDEKKGSSGEEQKAMKIPFDIDLNFTPDDQSMSQFLPAFVSHVSVN